MLGVGAGSLVGVLGVTLNMQLVALAGLLIGVVLVLALSYLPIRKFRAHMPAEAFKRLYVQNLTRTAGWAVASYLVWFIVISPILARMGVHIPRPK